MIREAVALTDSQAVIYVQRGEAVQLTIFQEDFHDEDSRTYQPSKAITMQNAEALKNLRDFLNQFFDEEDEDDEEDQKPGKRTKASAGFGSYLRKLRKTHKYTLEEFGEVLGVSRSALSRFERGTRAPSLDFLHDVAETLEVSYIGLLIKAGYVKEEEVLACRRVSGIFD